MKTARLLAVLLTVSGAFQLSTAAGEEFILKSGGRISGEILNPKQVPRTHYTVQTPEGVIFKIDRSQIVKKSFQRPEIVEYERTWPLAADTVEDQWKMAEWCRENVLSEQRRHHLKRIIQLAPDHEEARRALGYTREGNRWTTRDEKFSNQGYVRYEGEWRTRQEIQLIEEERRRDDAQNGWLQKLNTYRAQLESGNVAAARDAILQMKDPDAIKAIARALKDEANPIIREMYFHALGNMKTNQAAMLLAAAYMNEPVEELRYTCLDKMKGNRSAVDFFVGQLGSSKNSQVNRAGFALGYLEDPSAIAPLIRALVTVHKFRVKQGSPGQTSAGFGSNGNTGFSAGGSDKIVNVHTQNRDVLDALVKLTGQNFQFNDIGWKAWHASQRRYEHVNARRD